MKYFILALILLINFSFAQEIIIKAANSNGNAALFSLSGEKSSFIDSISAINYTYQFNLNSKNSGFYRLVFSNKKWVDFVYDNEDVEFQTDINSVPDNLKVTKSISNKIYNDFVNVNKDYKIKTELLQLIIARYPKTDNYYQRTKEKLSNVQEEYLYFINVTSQVNPNSFIARYVRSSQLPVFNPETVPDKQVTYFKSHALDKVNFSDDALIYSDAFTNKTIEYLSYYRNPQLPRGLLEKEFESAIDSILNKAKVNDIVYKHVVEYLLDGFKKYGFDNVINYIMDNYVIKDEVCLDEKLETALERRIQQSKNFKIGNSVPDILLPDSSGTLIDLNENNSQKTLIIFYASWCPHCKTMLPAIYDLYKKQGVKNIEVLAVSIDTVRSDWLNFIKTNNFNWLNVSDLKGWAGKAVLDYYIYATPTMFLIDDQNRIISMPGSIQELKNIF